MATAGKSRASKQKINKVLRETFGLEELRDAQAEVIDSVMKGQHTLAVMPTGAGKSLCYQLPGVLLEGTTVVISPLIALMRDQKEKLDDLEIDAVELNSTLTKTEQTETMKTIKSGTEVLYTTPERLANPEFLKTLKKIKIDLLVIDEAHCMTQWGHDFRPDYLAIPDAWKQLGEPQILALTATATGEVIEDIKKQFALPKLNVVVSGVFRENLVYEAIHLESESEKLQRLVETVKENSGSGIIYSATVKAIDTIYDALEAAGISAVKYHGKMKTKDRHENQRLFMSGEVPIVVATNAFGMGVDKSDIRFVIHFHFSGSLEAYYQESGRAGRDGEEARCTLLYLKQDKRTQAFFLAGKYPSSEDVFAVYQVLSAKDGILLPELQESLPGVAKSKTKVIVSALRVAGIAVSARGKGLSIKKKGLEQNDLKSIFDSYQSKKVHDQEKLKAMIVYAQSSTCRWKILLKYFEQNVDWSECGHCDNCANHHGLIEVAETASDAINETIALHA